MRKIELTEAEWALAIAILKDAIKDSVVGRDLFRKELQRAINANRFKQPLKDDYEYWKQRVIQMRQLLAKLEREEDQDD